MSTGSQRKPSWQQDNCPTWCVSKHKEGDHPDDRVHDSRGTFISAILDESGAEADHLQTGELLIITSRRSGHLEEWTFIGEPDRQRQYLRLSRESAQRLAAALTEHLRSLT